MMIRKCARLLAVVITLICGPGPAFAQEREVGRAVSVDDIVELEAFGRAEFSPDRRWAVYEKRGAYDSAVRFDFAARAPWTIMDLWLVDLSAPDRPPERLLPDEGLGLQRVAWSPDGGRLLISRFRGDEYEFGVVNRWRPERRPPDATGHRRPRRPRQVCLSARRGHPP